MFVLPPFVCVCVCVHVTAHVCLCALLSMVCMSRSKDNLCDSVLSFHHEGPRVRTHMARFSGYCLSTLTHFNSPVPAFGNHSCKYMPPLVALRRRRKVGEKVPIGMQLGIVTLSVV